MGALFDDGFQPITEGWRALDLFTDRYPIIRLFSGWLHEDQAPSRILFLWGDGGNGKSLLLNYLRQFCCKRRSRVVDEWSESSVAEYRRLVSDFEMEIRERMAGPSLAGFRRIADDAREDEARSQRSGVDLVAKGKQVLGFGPALRQAFDTYVKSELGMSLQTAAERLEEMKNSGKTVEEFIEEQGRKALFRSAAHAEKASQFVQWANVMDALGPLVTQLGEAVLDFVGELMTAQRAKEREERRRELRDQLDKAAQKLEREAAADFDAACDGLSRWIYERIAALEEGKSGLEQRVKVLGDYAGTLDGAVQTFPGGSGDS